MTSRSTTVLVGVASLFAGLAIPVANAQQVSGPVRVVQLTGLVGVKDNAKGTEVSRAETCILSMAKQARM